MKLRLLAVAVALAGTWYVPGIDAAAPLPQPRQDDVRPLWSPDARYLLFRRELRSRSEYHTVSAGRGAFVGREAEEPRGWTADDAVGSELGGTTVIRSLGGTPVAGFAGTGAAWSPDGTRVAYVAAGGIQVGGVVGRNPVRVAPAPAASVPWDVSGIVWSRDGTKLAYSESSGSASSAIRVAAADGSGVRTVFSGPNSNVNPTFSPDGSQLTFETNAAPEWRVLVVGVDGSSPHPLETGNWSDRLPRWSPNGRTLAVLSDRSGIPGPLGGTAWDLWLVSTDRSSRDLRVAYDLDPLSPASWSPTGLQIAYSAGRECLRWGIYVQNVETRHERRLTNGCHIDGTPRRDDLVGTPYRDFIRGFGESDTIHGLAGSDKIEGNAGDDRIDAGDGNDAVFGGPGSDRITAGGGNDLVVGGPGRDVISAGSGADRVEARDGFRDTIDCGPGRDTAEVDRLDVVHGCETVLRSK